MAKSRAGAPANVLALALAQYCTWLHLWTEHWTWPSHLSFCSEMKLCTAQVNVQVHCTYNIQRLHYFDRGSWLSTAFPNICISSQLCIVSVHISTKYHTPQKLFFASATSSEGLFTIFSFYPWVEGWGLFTDQKVAIPHPISMQNIRFKR